jgi:hypothetical protein
MEPTFVHISIRTLSLLSNSDLLKLWVKFRYYINILCMHSQKQDSRNSDMNTLGFYSLGIWHCSTGQSDLNNGKQYSVLYLNDWSVQEFFVEIINYPLMQQHVPEEWNP